MRAHRKKACVGLLAVCSLAGVLAKGQAQESRGLIVMNPLADGVTLQPSRHGLERAGRRVMKRLADPVRSLSSIGIQRVRAVKPADGKFMFAPVRVLPYLGDGNGESRRRVDLRKAAARKRVPRFPRVWLAQAGKGRPVKKVTPYELIREGVTIRVTAKKSVIISLRRPIRGISIGDPAVADFVRIPPNELILIGKTPGTTNLIVWDDRERRFMLDVLVQADAESLAEGIKELYPKESLTVKAIKDTIVLSGVTAREDVKEAVGLVAESFAPKKVVNLVRVGDRAVQISLKVQILEVSRTAVRELGFDFLARGRLGSEPGTIGVFPRGPGLSGSFGETAAGAAFTFSSLVNFFILDSTSRLGLFLRALEERGDLKTLAEPRLVTKSGQTASFLAGGEFPIPVPQEGGTVTIDFKKFGVRLDFTPKIVEGGRIELKLAPEVSELDFANSVSVGGVAVPSITQRRTETVVELESGQIFAISGLIQNRLTKNVSKVPWIGDIPILGKLFTSTRFNRRETELLILVTPEIVKPAAVGDPMPLPRGVSLGRGI